MALFCPSQCLEPFGDEVETLVAGGLCEPGIHLCVLVGLPGNGRAEIVLRRAHGHASNRVAYLGEEVKMAKGVPRLPLCDRPEQGGDIWVALHVRLLGEVEVAPVSLALPSKGFFEIGLGLAVLQSCQLGCFLSVSLSIERAGWRRGGRRCNRRSGPGRPLRPTPP